MKILKRIGVLILLTLLCLISYIAGIYSTVGPTDTEYVPRKGLWYCEDIQMTLSFDPDVFGYSMKDGEMKYCMATNNPVSSYVSVAYYTKEESGYLMGDHAFFSNSIYLSDSEFILKDRDTGQIYVFLRVD